MLNSIQIGLILFIVFLTSCQMPIQNQHDPSRMLPLLTGKGKGPQLEKDTTIPIVDKSHVIDVLAGKTEARFWLQHLISADYFGSSSHFNFLNELDKQQRQVPDLDKNCNFDVLSYLGCYQALSVLSLHFNELMVEAALEQHYKKHFPTARFEGVVPSVLVLGDFKILKVAKAENVKKLSDEINQGEKIRQEWVDKMRLFSQYQRQTNPNSMALKNTISIPPWSKLFSMYLDRILIQVVDQKLRNEIFIKAMNEYLQANDSFAKVVLQADQAQELNNADSSLIGLGIEIREINKYVTIQNVLEGSGAEIAGLKTGDQFLSVGGIPVVGIAFQDFLKLTLGEENSQVAVRVQRQQSQIDMMVTRKKVVFLNVTPKVYGAATYVKVRTFMDMSDNGQSLSSKFIKILTDVQQSNQKALIIDLRNNGGGLLGEALKMLTPIVSERLPNGVLLYEKTTPVAGEVVVQEYKLPAGRTNIKFNKPVIVLINSGSASASEVFAGTIQATGAGWVVGQESFGKGCIQSMSPGILPNLLVSQTTGYYFFTNQVSPHVDGVTPDFTVKTENKGLRMKDLEPAEVSQNSHPWVNPRKEAIAQLQSCVSSKSNEFGADEELKFALNLLNCLP